MLMNQRPKVCEYPSRPFLDGERSAIGRGVESTNIGKAMVPLRGVTCQTPKSLRRRLGSLSIRTFNETQFVYQPPLRQRTVVVRIDAAGGAFSLGLALPIGLLNAQGIKNMAKSSTHFPPLSGSAPGGQVAEKQAKKFSRLARPDARVSCA